MLSSAEFVRYSLELNLFFGRIAKEHSIFIEGSFTPRDPNLGRQADEFKIQFEALLADTISLANGVISPEVSMSGELVTQYTLEAERASQYYTGISINSALTEAEIGIAGNPCVIPVPLRELEQRVCALNERAMALASALADFKSGILQNVLACRLFTTNYPLLLDHILREAEFYLRMLTRLQNRKRINSPKELLNQQVFWNRIMNEHSLFIRGLLDPTEQELITTANNFGNEFNTLTREAQAAMNVTTPLAELTAETLDATKRLRDFKATGTKGLIECSIRAIAYPLLGDHVLREANHYIRLLSS